MGAVTPPTETASPGAAWGPARTGGARRLLPVAVLVAVLAVIVFGGFALAGVAAPPAGAPLTVGGSVRVTPVGGWQAGAGPSASSALLSRGGGNLEVHAFTVRSDGEQLLRGYVTRFLEPQARRLSVSSSVERIRLASGLLAARIAYVGLFAGVQGQIEGEVTAAVGAGGVGAVFDGWAPVGLLPYVLNDLRTMVDTAVVD